MAQKLAFLHALSRLHSGTGQGVGSIDLPIARERATNLPFVPGSSIKGCLRDGLKLDDKTTIAIFGPKRGTDASLHSGVLRCSDARLLLLPVRSLAATFVWATSPFILHRFRRDAEAAGLGALPAVPRLDDGQARLAAKDALVKIGTEEKLVLEELDFKATVADEALQWSTWIGERLFSTADVAWREELKKRFAIIDDKSFDHLAEFATEINAHIAIDAAKGTVEPGALWYQESLPAETVLSMILEAENARDGSLAASQILDKIPPTSSVQFGGKATTGEGVVRLVPVGGAL